MILERNTVQVQPAMYRTLMIAVALIFCIGLSLSPSRSINADTPIDESPSSSSHLTNCLYVTPNGPIDGGDFGPKTPGTKTSGLQEAFDAAKARNMSLYISGGSITNVDSQPVVYFLHETLNIPWMQDFRLDGGHYVIQYTPTVGDAVVIDSQMSCSYRFGLIVSNADGAVVRLTPKTNGPDKFNVITSTEFVFNAIVGGGGAWPGGTPYESKINPDHQWKGIGLFLDGELGSIDANKITVIETVGCNVGMLVTGKSTRNTIEQSNIHLCQTHLVLGEPGDATVSDNRIEAFVDSHGIADAIGVRIFGTDNLLTFSSSNMRADSDLIFESSAKGNLVIASRLGSGFTNDATTPTNRLEVPPSAKLKTLTAALAAANTSTVNRNPWPVMITITDAGQVDWWSEVDVQGQSLDRHSQLQRGDILLLNPGEGFIWSGSKPPQWSWKGIH